MVLEHVYDEEKALRELNRVLKQNGRVILTLPIVSDMKTYEDKTIVTPENRRKYYGQDDHVRLYGGDTLEHLKSIWNESNGCNVVSFDPIKEYGRKLCRKKGYHADIPIFILIKD